MSHFTVIVFGESPDELIERYDENLATDPYVSETKEQLIKRLLRERSDYNKTTYAEYLSDPDTYEKSANNQGHIDYLKIEFPKRLEMTGEQLYESYVKDETLNDAGDIMSQYNPNSKWDWYAVGGRWDGYFLNKYEKLVNQLTKGDIALDEMIERAVIRANKRFDEFESVTKGIEPPQSNFRDSIKMLGGNVDTAREVWRNHEWVKALENAKLNPMMDDAYDHWCVGTGGRETFIKQVRNEVLLPFAFVDVNGEWHERARMGWFGMSTDEIDENDWADEFMSYFNSLPNDTLITLLDCHI